MSSFESRVRNEGPDVLAQFTCDGKSFVLRMEAAVALRVAAAIREKALLADEFAQAERIAADSAILLRAGSNFALSNDPRIIEEAKKRAAWDTDLRRFMPGGVKSEEAFGTPAVVLHPPRGV